MTSESELYNIEKEIRLLPEIISCHLERQGGELRQVELIVRPDTDEKAFREEVIGLLKNKFGVDVEERALSLHLLGETEEAMHAAGSEADRPQIQSFTISGEDTEIETEVVLSHGDRRGRGSRRGLKSGQQRLRLVAEATLLALEDLLNKERTLYLEDIAVSQLSEYQAVIVLVHVITPGWERLVTGSSRFNGASLSSDEIVVHATLNALNRLLDRLQ